MTTGLNVYSLVSTLSGQTLIRLVGESAQMHTCLLRLLLLIALMPTAASARGWGKVRYPAPGPAQSYGSYTSGCIEGAVALPESGLGFRSVRRHRRRFFAHPDMHDYLYRLGQRYADHGLPEAYIGDISQPRGGKMPTGHRSHRIGLDVDIWFTHPRRVTREGDECFPSLVDERRETIDESVLEPYHFEMLRIAAQDPAVARVFVNWVIKQALCEEIEGDRRWLRKIRPWYGHDRHFHVRLACPADSPGCQDQADPPLGDGCGTETYFSKTASAARRRAAKSKAGRKGKPARKMPRFPNKCKSILNLPDKPPLF